MLNVGSLLNRRLRQHLRWAVCHTGSSQRLSSAVAVLFRAHRCLPARSGCAYIVRPASYYSWQSRTFQLLALRALVVDNFSWRTCFVNAVLGTGARLLRHDRVYGSAAGLVFGSLTFPLQAASVRLQLDCWKRQNRYIQWRMYQQLRVPAHRWSPTSVHWSLFMGMRRQVAVV